MPYGICSNIPQQFVSSKDYNFVHNMDKLYQSGYFHRKNFPEEYFPQCDIYESRSAFLHKVLINDIDLI